MGKKLFAVAKVSIGLINIVAFAWFYSLVYFINIEQMELIHMELLLAFFVFTSMSAIVCLADGASDLVRGNSK